MKKHAAFADEPHEVWSIDEDDVDTRSGMHGVGPEGIDDLFEAVPIRIEAERNGLSCRIRATSRAAICGPFYLEVARE